MTLSSATTLLFFVLDPFGNVPKVLVELKGIEARRRERILLREYELWDLPMRRRGLRNRLFSLYVDALKRGGRVSLGQGAAL